MCPDAATQLKQLRGGGGALAPASPPARPQATLNNQLPEGYPAVTGGISIHYHGLQMKGRWACGTCVRYMQAAGCTDDRGSGIGAEQACKLPPMAILTKQCSRATACSSALLAVCGRNSMLLMLQRSAAQCAYVPPPAPQTVPHASSLLLQGCLARWCALHRVMPAGPWAVCDLPVPGMQLLGSTGSHTSCSS